MTDKCFQACYQEFDFEKWLDIDFFSNWIVFFVFSFSVWWLRKCYWNGNIVSTVDKFWKGKWLWKKTHTEYDENKYILLK